MRLEWIQERHFLFIKYLQRKNWNKTRPFLQPLDLKFGNKITTREFLYVPECPIPFLGRDLLSKLNAQSVFDEGELFLKIPESKTGEILMIQEKVKEQEIPPEVDLAAIPTVWKQIFLVNRN